MKKMLWISVISSILLMSCTPKIAEPPLFTLDNLPVMDGSTVTIPLDEALVAALTRKTVEEVRPYVYHNKTHQAYINLIEKKADLIFVTSPSAEELSMAASAGITYEIIPIVSEAFIFLTHKDNPVDSLTLSQIVDIYSGKITKWNEVGGSDSTIMAFQRPVNSGSQTGFLDLVMKNTVPMTPPSEWVYVGMGELIEAVATYENKSDALGYSYYYFVTDMWGNDQVKLLKVNNVYPDKTSIANGKYPIRTAYYAIFRKDEPANSDVRKIVSWILSKEGQQLMEDNGYVKVK
jgi:phosphate transport system substrate-binding protein